MQTCNIKIDNNNLKILDKIIKKYFMKYIGDNV